MLMGIWLDQPLALIIGILASLFAGISIVLIVLTNVPATRAHLLNNVGGIVASFFSSIGILLALLTGFVANDAWERQGKASRIVQTERANLIAAYDLSEATVSDMSDIQKALLAYANAVIADEFPKMGTGTAYSSEAGAALSALMKMVADPVHTTASGAVAHTALMTTIMNLREARGERLALSASKERRFEMADVAVPLHADADLHRYRPCGQAARPGDHARHLLHGDGGNALCHRAPRAALRWSLRHRARSVRAG